MKVLVACEESQEVCKAFRARGHEAYSCDIQEPSGGHPEWHILGDALKAIKGGGQVVTEMLETAIRRVGGEYADMLFEYDRQRREAEKQCEQLAMEGMMKK